MSIALTFVQIGSIRLFCFFFFQYYKEIILLCKYEELKFIKACIWTKDWINFRSMYIKLSLILLIPLLQFLYQEAEVIPFDTVRDC